jgi:hypothetical protein
VTLTTSISAPAQIVNGDASMGQQLAQKWCSDCHAVGAEDAEAYGSMPLRAHLCIGEMWRTKLEEACLGCFAPQISGWNDSDGEPLALVYAQEHGAGLEVTARRLCCVRFTSRR